MPRTRPIFPIAVSIEAAAKAMKVPARVIRDAVYVAAELPAYGGPGNRVRIIVRDLEQWVRETWPRATIARQLKRSRSHGD